MKKTIGLLGWTSVFLTITTLIFTLLTTYQFMYIKYFDSYYTLQWCMFITLMIWAIKMFDTRIDSKNVIYSGVCILLAVGTVFFMYMRVY